MIFFNEITCDYKMVDDFIKETTMQPLMTRFESAFLLGVIEHYRPKTIVEVGVASGVTTAMILKKLLQSNYQAKLYSLDLLNYCVENNKKLTGYYASEYYSNLISDNLTFNLFTGSVSAKYFQNIEGIIDLLILDTSHVIPGEILDFLLFLPKMAEGSLVILHDINLQFLNFMEYHNNSATLELFSSVVADKYLNLDSTGNDIFTNIALFIVNHKTKDHIENVFLTLCNRWVGRLDNSDLTLYDNVFSQYYDDHIYKLFRISIELNSNENHETISIPIKRRSIGYFLYKVNKTLIYLKSYGILSFFSLLFTRITRTSK